MIHHDAQEHFLVLGQGAIVVTAALLWTLVNAQASGAEHMDKVSKRMFTAVLLVRGSVSGGNVGSYGVFVRNGDDTTWTKVTGANVISFGLGYFEHHETRLHYLAAGNGLHRSTDGGKTWRILTSWMTEEILGVVPDPVDSRVIYLATPFSVFKTTDDGTTWFRKTNGLKKWFIQRIIMDIRDHRTLYAASEDDLYKTTDAGENWLPMHVGAPNPLALMQDPGEPEKLLAGFEDGGIRYTADEGKTWIVSNGLQGSSIYALRASADGKEIYAAGWQTGLWRSGDGGGTWMHIWSDSAFEAIYSILVDPADARHIVVGSVGAGVFESRNHGVSWKHIGLRGAQVKQIELYP